MRSGRSAGQYYFRSVVLSQYLALFSPNSVRTVADKDAITRWLRIEGKDKHEDGLSLERGKTQMANVCACSSSADSSEAPSAMFETHSLRNNGSPVCVALSRNVASHLPSRSRHQVDFFICPLCSSHFKPKMGVEGLQTFVTENALLVSHRLQDTVLIIDGLNLENELYSAFLKSHNDKAYGGDYTHLTLYTEDFFKGLQECGIKPVVIMDGSFEAVKLEKVKERFNYALDYAMDIYKGDGALAVNSLLNPYVFVQIVKRLGIPVYKSILEADNILPQIAIDLRAPVLSNDSNFLMENIPAGVINPKSILSPNLKLKTDNATEKKFINCKIYKLVFLQQMFPGLKSELVPIAGAILGNDYNYLPFDLQIEETKQILGKLPHSPVRITKLRQSQIYQVFWWLSSQPSTVSVIASLKQICGISNHQLDRCIKDRYLSPNHSSFKRQSPSVGKYFTENRAKLFKREAGFPEWAHDRLIDESLQKRAISIIRGQIEYFQPLVEDFSLEQSSYETVFELCESIYGLLRSDDKSPKVVKRFVRNGDERLDELVKPAVEIGNKPLPLFAEIGNFSQAERIALFYEILGISSSIQSEIKSLLPSTLSASTIDQFTTLILSVIYLCRHYLYDLSLEFVYALATNLLFMGHFTVEDRVPTVLEMNKDEHDKLLLFLKGFDVIPSQAKGYQARIVHQYNAFQNCLDNIIFLAQILNLADDVHANLLVSGLQGTFLYNLTVDLSSRSEPLLHLEKALLDESPFKYFNLFQNMLDLLLKYSNRKFIVTYKSINDRDIIPAVYQVKKINTDQEGRLFVRGLKDTFG